MPQAQSIAQEFYTISTSIQSLLDRNQKALLIVCAARDEFLHDLAAECSEQGLEEDRSEGIGQQQNDSSILQPTIKFIARSKHVKVVYTPSLLHLRAFLAALAFMENPGEVLAILNLVHLHVSTSEHSAQGISRTLALAAEAAASSRTQLQILEIKNTQQYAGEEQDYSAWRDRIPILNGSVRSAGDDRLWASRTIEVGAVLSKWCKVQLGSRNTLP